MTPDNTELDRIVAFRRDARKEVFQTADMLLQVANASPYWSADARSCAAHLVKTLREHFDHSAAADVDRQASHRLIELQGQGK